MNNYNWISTYYDRLAQLIFGQSQICAQRDQLQFLKANSCVLIVGGGTGLILEDISKLKLEGIAIDFVEASAGMMEIAKKRSASNVVLNYFNLRLEDFKSDREYDVVLTSFFFDNFRVEEAKINFLLIYERLKYNGLWLFCDFSLADRSGLFWKVPLIKIMYVFFRVVASLKTFQLVDMHQQFEERNFVLKLERWYFRNFIRATVYKKVKLEN